jgi:hypothetical protein
MSWFQAVAFKCNLYRYVQAIAGQRRTLSGALQRMTRRAIAAAFGTWWGC